MSEYPAVNNDFEHMKDDDLRPLCGQSEFESLLP